MKLFIITFAYIFVFPNLYAQRSIDITLASGAPPIYVPTYESVCSETSNDLELVWIDDFNGLSLDLTKWKPSLPWGLGNDDGSDTWCDINDINLTGTGSIKFGCKFNPNNVTVSGNSVFKPYSVGVISSLEKFNYGYYEIKCKIPRISKHWPAFWLFGDCKQEIDVFEFTGHEHIHSNDVTKLDLCNPWKSDWYIPNECSSANPIMSYHSPISNCTNAPSRQKREIGKTIRYSVWDVNPTPFDINHGCQYSKTIDVDYHTDWHTFGMKFSPEGITWYIDGQPKITEHRYFYIQSWVYVPYIGDYEPIYAPIANLENFCSTNPTSQIYEQINLPTKNIDMHVIIGNGHESAGHFPGYNLFDFVDQWGGNYWPDGFLEVDYFKYYRFSECNKNLEFCNNNQISSYYNNVKAKNITLKSGCIINMPSNSNLNLKALEEIKILSEFSINNTSEFSAQIKNCVNGNINRSSNLMSQDSTNEIEYYNPRIYNITNNKSTLGTNNQKQLYDNFIIYPSPSNGQFVIKTENDSPKKINIINNLGIIVFSDYWKSDEINLNLNLNSGVYYVEVITNEVKSQKKIVIEN